MKLSIVYTKEDTRVLFYNEPYLNMELLNCINPENPLPLKPIEYFLVDRLYVVAPACMVEDWFDDDNDFLIPDPFGGVDKIKVRLENPSRFIMNLLRRGFRKDLSLIPVYETMRELVS